MDASLTRWKDIENTRRSTFQCGFGNGLIALGVFLTIYAGLRPLWRFMGWENVESWTAAIYALGIIHVGVAVITLAHSILLHVVRRKINRAKAVLERVTGTPHDRQRARETLTVYLQTLADGEYGIAWGVPLTVFGLLSAIWLTLMLPLHELIGGLGVLSLWVLLLSMLYIVLNASSYELRGHALFRS